MGSSFVFDQPHYDSLNAARERTIRGLFDSLRRHYTLRTAVDLGCGMGHFSGFLRSLRFDVVALDGRPENLSEAKRRFPEIDFRLMDAEDIRIREVGQFDVVLCMGLYYHLENPFAAFRNCFAMTRQIAVVEGMCVPGREPMLAVRDEGPTEDQGLRHVALYPSENGLIKLLYRSGYPFVYRFRRMPDHPNYASSSLSRQSRTMVVAAVIPLESELLEAAIEPVTSPDPWTIRRHPLALIRAVRGNTARLWRFLKKPRNEQARSIFFRWARACPAVPIPVRLPFGGWWLARNDFVGAALFQRGFENAERVFVASFLRPGMTVLDIGAHHGYYSLLASRRVGPSGKVLAIEASPREQKSLRLHLRINRCKNVVVESRAVGETAGNTELHVVCGSETGCNSLRRPAVAQPTTVVPVVVERLDRVLEDHGISEVDFIKLDVEGAELPVLKGAEGVLHARLRPVILAEVQDIRTRPWGYQAREVVRYLSSVNYRWFRPLPDGTLQKINAEQDEYDGNFVAIPEERLATLGGIITATDAAVGVSHSKGVSLAS